MTAKKTKAKPLKSLTTKRAPAPTDGHEAIDEWIRRVMPELNVIVKHLDELIRQIPNLQYAVKWKKAYYGLPERGWIIEMAAYDVSVNVVFFAGADLDPPPPLGHLGKSRYVKVRTLEEARAPAMREWVEQAARMCGWK